MDVCIRMSDTTAINVARTLEIVAGYAKVTSTDRDVLTDLAILLRRAKPATQPLSPRQHQLLAYLHDYIESRGYAPNFQEMADHFGYKSLATIHEHLGVLEKKGYIRRVFNEARSIEIVNLTPDLQGA